MRAGVALGVLGLAAVGGFAIQRARSTVLAVEAQHAVAAEIAADVGLTAVEVMALHELAGAALDAEALRARARAFVTARARLGDEALGVLAVEGHESLAVELLADAGGDAARAAAALRSRPEGVLAVRFASVCERLERRTGPEPR